MATRANIGTAATRTLQGTHLLADLDGLHVGDRLPSERELAARLQVSRSSVRNALAIMRERGEIVTKPGRSGTVIATDIAHQTMSSRIDVNAKSARIFNRSTASTSGLPHMLASQGIDCTTTVISARIQQCSDQICQLFRVPTSQPLIRVERVRMVSNQPFSYEQTYLHPHDYPDFLDHDMTQSIYQTLQFEYGTTIRSVDETIEVMPGFGNAVKYLHIPTGTPLLCAFSRAKDVLGHTVIVSIDTYVATQVRLTTSHTLPE